jgi:hypothetical protein
MALNTLSPVDSNKCKRSRYDTIVSSDVFMARKQSAVQRQLHYMKRQQSQSENIQSSSASESLNTISISQPPRKRQQMSTRAGPGSQTGTSEPKRSFVQRVSRIFHHHKSKIQQKPKSGSSKPVSESGRNTEEEEQPPPLPPRRVPSRNIGAFASRHIHVRPVPPPPLPPRPSKSKVMPTDIVEHCDDLDSSVVIQESECRGASPIIDSIAQESEFNTRLPRPRKLASTPASTPPPTTTIAAPAQLVHEDSQHDLDESWNAICISDVEEDDTENVVTVVAAGHRRGKKRNASISIDAPVTNRGKASNNPTVFHRRAYSSATVSQATIMLSRRRGHRVAASADFATMARTFNPRRVINSVEPELAKIRNPLDRRIARMKAELEVVESQTKVYDDQMHELTKHVRSLKKSLRKEAIARKAKAKAAQSDVAAPIISPPPKASPSAPTTTKASVRMVMSKRDTQTPKGFAKLIRNRAAVATKHSGHRRNGSQADLLSQQLRQLGYGTTSVKIALRRTRAALASQPSTKQRRSRLPTTQEES